jgi:hypothetical protein
MKVFFSIWSPFLVDIRILQQISCYKISFRDGAKTGCHYDVSPTDVPPNEISWTTSF